MRNLKGGMRFLTQMSRENGRQDTLHKTGRRGVQKSLFPPATVLSGRKEGMKLADFVYSLSRRATTEVLFANTVLNTGEYFLPRSIRSSFSSSVISASILKNSRIS